MAEERVSCKILAILVGAVAILSACNFKFDSQLARERTTAYVDIHPKLDAKTRAAILSHSLLAGMSKSEVIAAWGRPVDISQYNEGKDEEWAFGCNYPHICYDFDQDRRKPRIFRDSQHRPRAYFEDGKLRKWSL
jgi:hypothetical protein